MKVHSLSNIIILIKDLKVHSLLEVKLFLICILLMKLNINKQCKQSGLYYKYYK